MEGITITEFERNARLDIDSFHIYLSNKEAKKFSSILEELEAQGFENPIQPAEEVAIRCFIRIYKILF